MSSRQRTLCFLLAVFIFLLSGNVSPALPDSAVPAAVFSAGPVKTGIVTGRFFAQDVTSMAGGNVLFYNAEQGLSPDTTKFLRIPTLTVEILPEGIFGAELPVGTYYFFAVKRNSGEKFGRLSKGDYWFRFRDEKTAALKIFSITEGQRIDFGSLEAFPWLGKKTGAQTNKTTIEGTLFDLGGNPVQDVSILAFPTARMQGQRPLFASSHTGADGKYSLRVAGNATYFLMARSELGGGKLAAGEIIGVYGGSTPSGIAVKAGETATGKDITISRVPPRGPWEEAEARRQGGIGQLSGIAVDKNGAPLDGAFVYLFAAEGSGLTDAGSTAGDSVFWRRSEHVAGQLDSQGRFNLEVPAGSYHLAIIKRASGATLEPLQVGDIYYLHRFSGNSNRTVTINSGETTALGELTAHVYTAGGLADYPNVPAMASLAGTLTDRDGTPLPGAYILIYTEPDRLGPPLFSAGPSQADGSYSVTFYAEGTYYLAAKLNPAAGSEAEGDSPPGILLGRYGDQVSRPLVIRKDDIKTGIDIVLQPVGRKSWTE